MSDRKNLVLAAVFVAGLLVGWLVLGWLLFPVHWVNVDPWEMRPSARATYLDLVAEDYAIHQDKSRLEALLMGWPSADLAESLPRLITYHQRHGQVEQARALGMMMGALGTEVSHPVRKKGSALWKWIFSLIEVLLLTLLFVGVLYVVWRVKKSMEARTPVEQREEAGQKAVGVGPMPTSSPARVPEAPASPETTSSPARVPEAPASPQAAPPPVQVPEAPAIPEITPPPALKPGRQLLDRTVLEFHVGDEVDYTDSRDLVSEGRKEFFGNYGIAPEEWLDKRQELPWVFSVWLFDKLDINTKTVFLLTPGAWKNEDVRNALVKSSDQGEAQMLEIKPGSSFALETSGLYMRCVVSQVDYSSKADPEMAVSEIRLDVDVYRNTGAGIPSFLRNARK